MGRLMETITKALPSLDLLKNARPRGCSNDFIRKAVSHPPIRFSTHCAKPDHGQYMAFVCRKVATLALLLEQET